MKKIALSLVAIVGMSSFAFAEGDTVSVLEAGESSFYVGLGMAVVSARNSDFSVDWGGSSEVQERLGNISLLAGYNFNEYVAVEGRYSVSVAHEDSMEMNGWSLFVKPQYPVTEDFSVYALLGYGGVVLDGIDGSITDVDDSGFQWGIGAGYMVMENVSLFADYTWLTGMEGVFYNGALETDVDQFTVGVNYHF